VIVAPKTMIVVPISEIVSCVLLKDRFVAAVMYVRSMKFVVEATLVVVHLSLNVAMGNVVSRNLLNEESIKFLLTSKFFISSSFWFQRAK
jgi:hypothetical protein